MSEGSDSVEAQQQPTTSQQPIIFARAPALPLSQPSDTPLPCWRKNSCFLSLPPGFPRAFRISLIDVFPGHHVLKERFPDSDNPHTESAELPRSSRGCPLNHVFRQWTADPALGPRPKLAVTTLESEKYRRGGIAEERCFEGFVLLSLCPVI